MSIDPFTLILLIIFVVIPLVNGLIRGRRGGTPPAGPSPRPSQPSARPAQTVQRQKREDQREDRSAERGSQERDPDPFSRRLEEARRRVQEAVGGGEVSQNPQPSSPPPLLFPPFEEPRRAGRPQTPPATAPNGSRGGRGLEMGGRGLELGGQGLEGMPITGVPRTGSEPRRDVPSRVRKEKQAPPLRVQRNLGKRSARMSNGEFLELEKDDIFRGIVWHQILSEPLSKANRRRLSRRP